MKLKGIKKPLGCRVFNGTLVGSDNYSTHIVHAIIYIPILCAEKTGDILHLQYISSANIFPRNVKRYRRIGRREPDENGNPQQHDIAGPFSLID